LNTNFWWDVTESSDNDWMLCFGANNIRRLIMAINKVCVKHGHPDLIGPEIPKSSIAPTIDFEFDRDRGKYVITHMGKKTILIERNLISMEEYPDQLKFMVQTRTGVKPVCLKINHGQYRQALVNPLKEAIEFNSRMSKPTTV
jgi:hypothetical protein